MLVIEIKTAETKRRIVKAKDGVREFTFIEQEAYAHRLGGSAYPVRVSVGLRDGSMPYPVGMYQIDDVSYEVDRYGKIQLGRDMFLSPLPSDGKVKSAVNG